MNTLADIDPSIWEKVLGGQVGFILATVMFGLFFWKVLLPRWDATTQAIRDLTTAINTLVVQNTSKSDERFDHIMEELRKHD